MRMERARPVDDKLGRSSPYSLEQLQNGSAVIKARLHHRKAVGSRSKPTPSKWDDAQKWLAGHSHGKSKPRNSNADDRRLLGPVPHVGRDSISSADGALEDDAALALASLQEEGETKKIDCDESVWRISKPVEASAMALRSVCVRDMGTEMTPLASKEPSRTGTPLRAATPVLGSPISSRSSTPGRNRHGGAQPHGSHQTSMKNLGRGANGRPARVEGEQSKSPGSLESRAMAWDEAERAKYMARYKRDEVKIQVWENHEKKKAELEMKRMEMRAERMKSRAQEKLMNKLAATRRIAEEKRANAEAKLNEQAARTSERAGYIRRTGHLPSSYFFRKLPSLCH